MRTCNWAVGLTTLALSAAIVQGQRPDWVKVAPPPGAEGWELAPMLVIGSPGLGDYDLHDDLYGAEVEVRTWDVGPVGLGGLIGVARSSVNPTSRRVLSARLGRFSGETMLYTLGANVCLPIRFRYHPDWSLLLQGGLRYVVVDSNIRFRAHDNGARSKVDIDNGLLGHVALDVSRRMNERLSAFAGGGVQLDLVEGSVDVGDWPGRDSELKAFFLRLGARLQF